MFILPSLLFVALAQPEWLFTIKGCRHLSPSNAAIFDAAMDKQLGGCRKEIVPAGIIVYCGNGGTYLYFHDKQTCEDAVEQYRKDHET